MKYCDYRCGQEAAYQLKNEKWCCSEIFQKCLEFRRKMSEAMKGRKLSKDHKRNLSEAHKGRNHTKESKKKMSEAHKGRNHTKKSKKKMSESSKGKTHSKETRKKLSEANKGKTLSKEIRKKMRLAAIKNIEKNNGQISPNYNPQACKLIEEYGIENGCDFQHAENGGEFYIKDLGYWVDGYDKNKNIVIEIDEPHHFDFDGNLKKKDIQRQKEIIDFLGCEFIRIKINQVEVMSND